MNEKDGTDILKRISVLEEQLDKRFNASRKKATELVSKSRSEASRKIDKKYEELAKAQELNSETYVESNLADSTVLLKGYDLNSEIVSELSEHLFRLLIDRKRM